MRTSFIYLLIAVFVMNCKSDVDTSTPADFELNISDDRNVEFLKELIDDNESNPQNYIRLSHYYLMNNEPNKALETLTGALENTNSNTEIKLLLTSAYIRNDRLEDAESQFEKIATEELNSLLFYQVAGEYWFAKNNFVKSLNNINRAINIDQGSSELYALKARNLVHLYDTVGAVNNYILAIDKEQASFSTFIEFLHLLLAQKDDRLFNKIYADLDERWKEHQDTHFLLAKYLMETGEYDSAKAHVYPLTGNNEVEMQKIKLLSEINFKQRRYDSAIYYLKDYELISPELLFIRARAYDRLGRYQSSEDTYLKIIEIDSTNTIAADELAKLRRKVRYLQLKRREENRIRMVPVPRNPITPIN